MDETMNPDVLKPCPFCGGDAVPPYEFGGQWMIECSQCEANIDGFATDAAARNLWNRRAALTDGDA